MSVALFPFTRRRDLMGNMRTALGSQSPRVAEAERFRALQAAMARAIEIGVDPTRIQREADALEATIQAGSRSPIRAPGERA